MSPYPIRQFTCRSDNFGVLLHDPQSGSTLSIDAPEEAPILAALEREGWRLTHILTTHHHGDHVAANEALKERFGAQVVGPEAERARIPGLDRGVRGGDRFAVGSLRIEVIDTPGHTAGHVSYFVPAAGALFAADTLFSLGCGRLFEGDAATMWESVKRLRVLPDETMLFCGHEYTATNARFALDVDPGNLLLQERVKEVEALRVRGEATLPVALGREKRTNPFLRADDPELQGALGMAGEDPVAVFAALRERRNGY
ncbi:hydroxyacylglutathione hydrolase [Aureimonas flava]|uniref:Hydroxyacylglutathione hydrolase n=1 Tax=Aureimonas flava TaxID=2320271 RepID=A0A3A1WRL2_9HYPH|nr:hydroxyacylglutathione hydrolase [Aureimonas flava]RIY00015.1 hydroxyacylglutathione hydrolase [Aureimonas flava]